MPRPKGPARHPYPKNRAARVDRSKMTEEEWLEHKRRMDREKSMRWSVRNPGVSRAALRKRRAVNPWYSSLLAAGDRARKGGLDYDLTAEWAARTYTGKCSLTDLPFIVTAREPPGKSGGKPYSPSIDRINPLKGYTQDNCRWVLWSVNNFKTTLSDEGMYHVARALLAHEPGVTTTATNGGSTLLTPLPVTSLSFER